METPNEVERKQTKEFVTKDQETETETGKDADPMRKDDLEPRDAKPGVETKGEEAAKTTQTMVGHLAEGVVTEPTPKE